MSATTWGVAKIKKIEIPGRTYCADVCLADIGGRCNAWKFEDGSNICTLGKVKAG